MATFTMTKKIALIYMGGTFGCIGEPLSPMPEADFLQRLKRVLPAQHKIDCYSARHIIDSSAATASDWLELIRQIQQLQLAGYEHFVIIHGTDTLSYASAMLSKFLQTSCKVILTGSQYPLLNVQGDNTREFTDAVDNLNTAIDEVAKVQNGVYLAFYHQVFHASTAIKVHTTALDAFRGQKVNQQLPYSPDNPFIVEKAHIEQAKEFNIINWMMQPISIQHLEHNLENLLNAPPHFLILQAYGTGNLAVSEKIIQTFKSLKKKNCLVVLTTQVPLGGIDQRYAISQWIKHAEILISDCQSLADLYAKALKMYLQYPSLEQWYSHWYDQPE
ncbi:L-asparaginase 1 [Acinetobacter stercoris]|uniref:L-asparaginase 1 n=2 Tax=Acinetobacter stercoris TaxID=2126983 RepID=A0A2U3MYB2_9GAMM|nr:L-asparaginase 1 [Acinetobacter stercoris]